MHVHACLRVYVCVRACVGVCARAGMRVQCTRAYVHYGCRYIMAVCARACVRHGHCTCFTVCNCVFHERMYMVYLWIYILLYYT